MMKTIMTLLLLFPAASVAQYGSCEHILFRNLQELEANSEYNPLNYFNPKSNPFTAAGMGAVSWAAQNWAGTALRNRATQSYQTRMTKNDLVHEAAGLRRSGSMTPKALEAVYARLDAAANHPALQPFRQLNNLMHGRAASTAGSVKPWERLSSAERIRSAKYAGFRGAIFGMGASLAMRYIAVKNCGGGTTNSFAAQWGPRYNAIDGCYIPVDSMMHLLDSPYARRELCEQDPEINAIFHQVLQDQSKVIPNKSLVINKCTGGEASFDVTTADGYTMKYDVLVYPGSHLEVKVEIPPNPNLPLNYNDESVRYTFDYSPDLLPTEMFGQSLKDPSGFTVTSNTDPEATRPIAYVQTAVLHKTELGDLLPEPRGRLVVGDSLIRGVNSIAIVAPACLHAAPAVPSSFTEITNPEGAGIETAEALQ